MKVQWPIKFKEFSKDDLRWMAVLAMALFAGGLFIKLTWELHEDSSLDGIDKIILSTVGHLRVAALNGPAVDITALGSATVTLLLCLVSCTVLWLAKNRKGALFLLVSASGAGAMAVTLKHLFHRERPTIIPRLVEVTDFSYPSGHTITSAAVFLSLALLASRHFTEWQAKVILFALSGFLVGLVALSRLYLGVHYPSDVLSGILLGTAWALGLAVFFFSRRSSVQ